MELVDLGLNEWFREKWEAYRGEGYRLARVTAVNRDNYLVRSEHGEALAEPSGDFLYSTETNADLPVVGDWALVRYFNEDTLAIIYGLLPRQTVLRRKTSGKKVAYQMIAANIDAAFIVQSCDFNFNLRRLERYLVMVSDGGIRPVMLLSKSDLISQEELEKRIAAIRAARIDCMVIAYSSLSPSGLEQVRQALEPSKTYCLLGSSGVGKTTLLNSLLGKEAFETNLVREKDSKGRHTTSRRQLVIIPGGAMLVDTPGMRELGNIDVDAGLDDIFADIRELAPLCRFADCTHTSEEGCAVIQAVSRGEIPEERYQSYLKLIKESEHYQLSYLEKRQKDKQFGKFLKSAKKDIKKFKKR